jgi:hypothetical protein
MVVLGMYTCREQPSKALLFLVSCCCQNPTTGALELEQSDALPPEVSMVPPRNRIHTGWTDQWNDWGAAGDCWLLAACDWLLMSVIRQADVWPEA